MSGCLGHVLGHVPDTEGFNCYTHEGAPRHAPSPLEHARR
jgi:hypothetical protein